MHHRMSIICINNVLRLMFLSFTEHLILIVPSIVVTPSESCYSVPIQERKIFFFQSSFGNFDQA